MQCNGSNSIDGNGFNTLAEFKEIKCSECNAMNAIQWTQCNACELMNATEWTQCN